MLNKTIFRVYHTTAILLPSRYPKSDTIRPDARCTTTASGSQALPKTLELYPGWILSDPLNPRCLYSKNTEYFLSEPLYYTKPKRWMKRVTTQPLERAGFTIPTPCPVRAGAARGDTLPWPGCRERWLFRSPALCRRARQSCSPALFWPSSTGGGRSPLVGARRSCSADPGGTSPEQLCPSRASHVPSVRCSPGPGLLQSLQRGTSKTIGEPYWCSSLAARSPVVNASSQPHHQGPPFSPALSGSAEGRSTRCRHAAMAQKRIFSLNLEQVCIRRAS